MIDYEERVRKTPMFHLILSVVMCIVTAFLTIRPFLSIDPFYAGVPDVLWLTSFLLFVGAVGWTFVNVIKLIFFFKNKDAWRIVQDSCYMLEYYDKVDSFHLIVDEIEQVSNNEYKLHSTLGEFYTKVDTPREVKKLSKAQDLITKDGEVYIDLTRMLKLRTPLIKEVDDKRYIQHLFRLRSIGFNQHSIII